MSYRVDVIAFRNFPLARRPGPDEFGMSAAGTVAAARIIPENGSSFTANSLCTRWEEPKPDSSEAAIPIKKTQCQSPSSQTRRTRISTNCVQRNAELKRPEIMIASARG